MQKYVKFSVIIMLYLTIFLGEKCKKNIFYYVDNGNLSQKISRYLTSQLLLVTVTVFLMRKNIKMEHFLRC
jgi:hypothetical protein